jgi:hypothetical protein
MMSLTSLSTIAALGGLLGCGSSPASPPANPAGAEPAESVEQPAAGPQASAGAASPAASASPADAAYDIVKGRDPINMKPLFDRAGIPSFPSATTSEQECWRTTGVVGTARLDYETLLSKRGSATGAVQYVRPSIGHLHHKHQRRDVYNVPILGGLCYRFFGVGDATINDLDIIIEQPGALVGDDATTRPQDRTRSSRATRRGASTTTAPTAFTSRPTARARASTSSASGLARGRSEPVHPASLPYWTLRLP